MNQPETRYAKTADGTHLAYQVLGEGPTDLIYISPWLSHLELRWAEPRYARYIRRLASFSRLILFDRRGQGLSDPEPLDRPATFETRVDDILTVLDTVGSSRAVVFGASESGSMAAVFAATHPDRTLALVIHGSSPRIAWAADWPTGETLEQHEADLDRVDRLWGTEEFVRLEFPTVAADAPFVRWFAAYQRASMSPGAALAFQRWWHEMDVRDALPAIHVPTLILHRREDAPEANRYIAEHIAGAEFVSLPGREHIPYLGNQDDVTREIERFVKSVRDEETALDRVLGTVLFTDIVGSTEVATRLGDRAWGDLLERHNAIVRSLLARYRGQEVDTAGDGFFATFDGPARAVKCALSVVQSVQPLGLQVRAGVHTGEIEMTGGKAGGLAVVVGARIGAQAGPSDVLVSQTVKDLTIGSGLIYEDRGEYELKGIPDRWRVYRGLSPGASDV